MPPTFFTVMNICCDQLQKALQYEAMVMPGAQQITENVRVIFRKICCAVANVKTLLSTLQIFPYTRNYMKT